MTLKNVIHVAVFRICEVLVTFGMCSRLFFYARTCLKETSETPPFCNGNVRESEEERGTAAARGGADFRGAGRGAGGGRAFSDVPPKGFAFGACAPLLLWWWWSSRAFLSKLGLTQQSNYLTCFSAPFLVVVVGVIESLSFYVGSNSTI